MIKKFIVLTLLGVLTIGCSKLKNGEQSFPQNPDDVRRERHGKLTGEGGLFSLGGDSKKSNSGPNISVNSYLWRAALDTVSFMPLASADPFGGTIITDWYEDPAAKGERFKVNILILGSVLRVDAVKVTVFKQNLDAKSIWRDSPVSAKVARTLEDKILTSARQLRVRQSQ
jgi:hypothetical protein